jgi:ATP-dependent DNA helicase DinG
MDLHERFNILTSDAPAQQIHWFETLTQHFIIRFTPLTVAEEFQKQINLAASAKIFTSATLAVKNDFNFFSEQLGLQDADKLQLEFAYDYQNLAKLYIPTHISDPTSAKFINDVVTAAIPVINAAKGRTFFLFTSYFALKAAAELLAGKIAYPILIQGQMPKTKLLDRFRELGNAVLLATNSFWEGVDVKGETLSCVIIDKLPFAAPSDPVLKAQIAALRKAGRDPFNEIQLNRAVISLKQGAGRLIRDEQDKGVLMICDPRICSKPYGHTFLASLPPFTLTRSLQEVQMFFGE